jgi:hypothetical protein
MNRALPLAVVCALSSGASAAIVQYEVNLNGLQVVAPNASPGLGVGQFNFDTSTNLLSVVSGSYQGLLGGALDVAIHGAALPNQNAGTLFMLTLDNPLTTTGTFSGSGALTAAQATSLSDGHLYLLIRSQAFPGGEIRGHLLQVPTPATAVLLSIAALTATRRRRH